MAETTLNRFAVSGWTPFKTNADSSLDLYLQNESPGADKETNWLPAPLSYELHKRAERGATSILRRFRAVSGKPARVQGNFSLFYGISSGNTSADDPPPLLKRPS